MKVEIKVISTEFIPPSSPTPIDRSKYKLSLLDQMGFPTFMPMTLFYQPANNNSNGSRSDISTILKKSLSRTLSLYYPLAGRIVDNSYVDCNDEGIMYVEALAADCKLLDVINEVSINQEELDKLLPSNLDDDFKQHCVIIQTTFFNCGGMSIGVAVSHKIGDAWSLTMFINSWAAISRGDDDDDDIPSPIFDGETLFPQRSNLGGFDPSSWVVKEDRITKKFTFTASKINELRDKYTNTSRASRVEALSVFIFTRFLVSTNAKDNPNTIFNLVSAVDIRKRATPPLSSDLFGNFVQHAIISLRKDDMNEYEIVDKMREAIESINGDYVKNISIQAFNPTSDDVKKFASGEMVPFVFTSLCRFPLYEADFRWGIPVWIGLGCGHQKNIVVFKDSFTGAGMEVWITLQTEAMDKFEADQEFLAYAAAAAT